MELAYAAVSERVIGACIEVHRELGPGLLESIYEECLGFELSEAGLAFERQRRVPILYKGRKLDREFRLDFVVEGVIAIELKCVQTLLPVHGAQAISYLRLAKLPVALLVNFHVARLREGLKRFVYEPREDEP